jgi:RNA polymerase sigma-70 factor (ECF subfamily)
MRILPLTIEQHDHAFARKRMMAGESDITLVLAARGGDKDAFGALLHRHRPLLLSLCRRMLGDPLLAEDAAQEAALAALLSLDRLRDPQRFGAWLCGIGLNICRNWLRDRTHDHWSWEAMLGGSKVDELIDWRIGPEEHAEVRKAPRAPQRLSPK